MKRVSVRREKTVIPTYEAGKYDKNPMFLEKRVYQGSSGRVYPHPVCESVADEKTMHEYDAIYLENDYLLVMILPELGGRIQRLYDKTNGYDAVYYNEVVKPALVGLAGPWISGGIEFNWPQHHRPSTYDPVDCRIVNNADGSVTVWVGETEKMFHTKANAGYTIYPDRAYLKIEGQLYNPTDRPQTFLWWANPAVAVNENTQSIFPPDVTAVMDHGKRDVSKFPIADGVYYKVNYAPGTDISRYKNIPVPTSYMAAHSDFDFIGNYDYGKQAGLLHVADHHVSPGKKQWTWGNGDFGRAWDRNLTDENGPYIELMTGMFTDNQPDFTFLKPYEEKTFVQYFMPYKQVGQIKNATERLSLGFDENTGSLIIYAAENMGDLQIQVLSGGRTILEENINLGTAECYETTVETAGLLTDDYEIRLSKDGELLLKYAPVKKDSEVPEPATEIPEPEKLDTTEKLFLAATHLEQYRHATRNPADYYLEGLRRDPSDIRLNNGYGKLLYKKGRFADSAEYFERAIASSTWKNPNPYDCEPYYNLGLTMLRLGQEAEAYDAFYKAAWDGNMQGKAFYWLACLETRQAHYDKAMNFANRSLVNGAHNMRARTLVNALLRTTGQNGAAVQYARASLEIDPLDRAAIYELYTTGQIDVTELEAEFRQDNHSYIELALCYMEAGLKSDARAVLALAPIEEPMKYYYLYQATGQNEYLQQADTADSLYCFPNRLEDMLCLGCAIAGGSIRAGYYQGLLLYDLGRWQEALDLWEEYASKVDDAGTIPTVYRNLSLAYYNKQKDAAKAQTALEKAFAMDTSDARVFFELDQLRKVTDQGSELRLEQMEEHRELLPTRDDLYTEYITLLNDTGKYEQAYDCMLNHKFHPWEGGEGKITAQYRRSLMAMAEGKPAEEAIKLLTQALTYPENLGEGKLAGAKDNDIYYKLACISSGDEATEYYRLAARGDFELTSAMYYNDQPPEMMYFCLLARAALGDREGSATQFKNMISYGREHLEDHKQIDYFAVSLPDFLIFEGDLDKYNRRHCSRLIELGEKGLAIINGNS